MTNELKYTITDEEEGVILSAESTEDGGVLISIGLEDEVVDSTIELDREHANAFATMVGAMANQLPEDSNVIEFQPAFTLDGPEVNENCYECPCGGHCGGVVEGF